MSALNNQHNEKEEIIRFNEIQEDSKKLDVADGLGLSRKATVWLYPHV